MSARADAIEKAADRAIYSDDPDVVEALRARIADLEAKRAQYKAANATYRRILRRAEGSQDQSRAEAQEAVLRSALRAGEITAEDFGNASGVRSLWRRDQWDTLPYSLTNLTADIARNRKRLDAMT